MPTTSGRATMSMGDAFVVCRAGLGVWRAAFGVCAASGVAVTVTTTGAAGPLASREAAVEPLPHAVRATAVTARVIVARMVGSVARGCTRTGRRLAMGGWLVMRKR